MPQRRPLHLLGQLLKQARETQGLSLQQTAAQVQRLTGHSLSRQYLSNVEHGRRTPSVPLLLALAEVLHLPVPQVLAQARKAEVVVRQYLQRRPDCEPAIIELFLVAEQQQFAAWERLLRQMQGTEMTKAGCPRRRKRVPRP